MNENNKVYKFQWTDSARYGQERNDCSVRSLSLCLNINYAQAHRILRQHGRKNKDGVYKEQFEQALDSACVLTGLFCTGDKYFPVTYKKYSCRTTPEKFCFDHPSGRFILSMASHFSVCIDGVIYDTNTHYGKLIYNYYEIKL